MRDSKSCFLIGAFCGAFIVICIWYFTPNKTSSDYDSSHKRDLACLNITVAKDNLSKTDTLKTYANQLNGYDVENTVSFDEYEKQQNEVISKNEPLCKEK